MPALVGEREQSLQVDLRTEQLGAQSIPAVGGGGEELLRGGAAGREHATDAAGVLARRRQRRRALAHQLPEALGVRLEAARAHAVAAARPLLAHVQPAVAGEHLEVAAHRRLRQLHDRAQLRDGELVALEHEQQPAARRLGEVAHALEQAGAGGRLPGGA